MRRIGVLLGYGADDPQGLRGLQNLIEALATLGWVKGKDVSYDVRWNSGVAVQTRRDAAELVRLAPDVIVVSTSEMASAVAKETNRIPVVFVGVTDPVGLGLVRNFAHPGTNMTGFANFEPSVGGKWLEMLGEIDPQATRVLALFSPETGSASLKMEPALRAAAQSLKLDVVARFAGTPREISGAVAEFARRPHGVLVVSPSSLMLKYAPEVVSAAAKNHVPAIYFNAIFIERGGLMSYAPPPFGKRTAQAATYVDRILRGSMPADLPVQNPKYELTINLRAAEALGLTVPASLLIQADEVLR